MTSIVGLIHDGDVYMGADSSITYDCEQWLNREPKIFRNGDYLLGVSGDARIIQLLRYAFMPPPPYPEDEVDDAQDYLMRFMTATFVPLLFDCLRDQRRLVIKDGIENVDGILLIGVRGRLFFMASGGHITEEMGHFIAAGSGAEVAFGYMYATEGRAPLERLIGALEAGARYNAYVRPPFVFECLQGQEKEQEC